MSELYDIVAERDQSYWDLAIQEYGSIDQIFLLFVDNKNFATMNTVPNPGEKVTIRVDFDGNKSLMAFFRGKIKVATGYVLSGIGIGYMKIGSTFKVN